MRPHPLWPWDPTLTWPGPSRLLAQVLTDFDGQKLDYWVTGYGTGGTFHGAGKAIKAARPDVKIILAEPEDAGLLASGIPTERNADGSPKESHPAF